MTKQFKIPWAAWRDPQYLTLDFPDSWDVSNLRMEGADYPEVNSQEIKASILNPIGTPKLSDIAKGKKNAVIVVDDMTRTTQASKILPSVFEELGNNGIGFANIKVANQEGELVEKERKLLRVK